ncbi:MAG: tRNA 5-methylaminomethyl-2-thiouridine biosynthesis bifunctional protein MnmC [Chlamydiales bacterium]|nr:tRNA 5-methylaminomethyl-2-thiouridine biosynthesis bifunctional protein MnmC [Chlamydiales bacterium]
MRVAILGAGFAGLSVSWFLLHYTSGTIKIDLYDPLPIGSGVSGLSSGLLHPYVGKKAKRSWAATRCMNETHRLLTEASQALNHPLILSKGILRPALSSQQIKDFQIVAKENSDTEWWDAQTCLTKIPGLHIPAEGGGLFIRDGLTVDTQKYLEGLWRACALLGTQHYQTMQVPAEKLMAYDRILVALGPSTKNFPNLQDLPITPVKGQILELKWPSNLQPPPHSLISQKYLVMDREQKKCFVGATYEHDFTSPEPDESIARAQILPKIYEYYPALQGAEILGCYAGFRAKPKTNLPLVGMLNEKVYFFTGLGSRGLLYHAWVGKHVARALLTGDSKHFPPEIHHLVES